MQQSEKILWTELLDSDTAPHLVSAKAFINAMNIRLGTTDDGYIGFFEKIKGNTEISTTLPTGTNICIGTASYESKGWCIFLNHNSNGNHGIYLYSIPNNTMYVVVEQSDITNGLNFDKYKLILRAFVVNGVLYFNDGTRDGQRCLNLAVFMTAQGSSPEAGPYTITFPISSTEITLIKKPHVYPPSAAKKYDASFNNNFIGNGSFQFAVEYVWYEGYRSVLGGWSLPTRFNQSSENYNYVEVKLNILEEVPQTVRKVRLILKDSSNEKGIGYVVKEWDRKISADNTLIAALNLKYDFYNNVTGEVIDQATMTRLFHHVPEYSGCMEPAKNRINLADNTSGKDTPTESSLSVSLSAAITLGFSSLTETVYELKHRNGRVGSESYAYIGYYVYLTQVLPVGWYLLNTYENLNTASGTYGSIGSPPASVAFSGLTFKGADLTAVVMATAESGTWRWDGPYLTSMGSLSITGISASAYSVMLPQSQFRAGVVFFDEYRRRTGVVFQEDYISIPARDYAFSSAYASALWALSNTSAASEIPSDAKYYAVLRTLNLSTRFFISSYDEATIYATRNASTGVLEYTTTTFGNNVVAIAIDSTALLRAGLGYTFSEGDQCILSKSGGSNYDLQVIGQDGKYILLKPSDIGTLNTAPATTVKFVYRIYTPYKVSDQEPFYEVGELYPVNNPGTSGREYSTLSGVFRGDITVLSRNYNGTTYLAEAMNPNDLYYQRWIHDGGQPNFISDLGSVRKQTSIRFSNPYIPGSMTNGLCAFEALNETILPEEMGAIKILYLAAKAQGEGTVMLAIGENLTASVYIGEVKLLSGNNNPFLVKADGYIGDVSILQGEYGTKNPESAVDADGQIAWIDVRKGKIIRYGGDGLFPISDYGMNRALNLFCKKFASLSVSAIEALGGRPFIFGGVNKRHNEWYWSIPKVESTPPKGSITDVTPSFTFPYDIYDGAAKVLVFRYDFKKWSAPVEYSPEMFCAVGNRTFAFKSGKPWENETNSLYNKFFGTEVSAKIMGVARGEKVSTWLNIAVETNETPSYAHFRTEDPNVQHTDLSYSNDKEWSIREGVHYAKIMCDRLSPNVTGTADEKLIKGDRMRGPWIYYMLEFSSTSQLKLKSFNITRKTLLGHKTI